MQTDPESEPTRDNVASTGGQTNSAHFEAQLPAKVVVHSSLSRQQITPVRIEDMQL